MQEQARQATTAGMVGRWMAFAQSKVKRRKEKAKQERHKAQEEERKMKERRQKGRAAAAEEGPPLKAPFRI